MKEAFGVFGIIVVHTADKLVETAYEVQDKTLNADNALYNYEWFKQQSEDIKALKEKLVIAKKAKETFDSDAGPRDKWTFEDKTESSRLGAVSQGIESQLVNAVADYNARTKMANRAIFKDGIIPGYIDAVTFEFKN